MDHLCRCGESTGQNPTPSLVDTLTTLVTEGTFSAEKSVRKPTTDHCQQPREGKGGTQDRMSAVPSQSLCLGPAGAGRQEGDRKASSLARMEGTPLVMEGTYQVCRIYKKLNKVSKVARRYKINIPKSVVLIYSSSGRWELKF